MQHPFRFFRIESDKDDFELSRQPASPAIFANQLCVVGVCSVPGPYPDSAGDACCVDSGEAAAGAGAGALPPDDVYMAAAHKLHAISKPHESWQLAPQTDRLGRRSAAVFIQSVEAWQHLRQQAYMYTH